MWYYALRFWKEVIIAALVLALVGMYTATLYLRAEVDRQKAQSLLFEQQVSALTISNKELVRTVASQNAAVERLEQEAKDNLDRFKVAISESAKTAQRYKKMAQDIMSRTPLMPKSMCDSANALINQEIRNAKP